ncbi:MAG: ComF family protein [Planctomycetes bacterium]|nr:ComF family protein [Planctomycetota bacterium]
MGGVILKQIAAFVLQSLNQLLWPAVCINCKQYICETDDGLCKKCWGELLACTSGDYCHRCGRDASRYAIVEGVCPDCQGKEIYFDQIARSGVYGEALRQMILAFKSGGRTELDVVLGFLADSAFSGSSFYNDVDLFVPVPLHWSRRLVRGYNQSQLLAKKLSHPKTKINTELVRIRHTKLQPAMASAAARARNVAGAFAVRYRNDFAGRNICLIDDIKTTGATLNECAKVLKEAGASKVFALVLAVAGQDRR